MHEHSHTIIRLPVHLPNQQPVYFQQGHEEEALERSSHGDTQLTAWFKLNVSDETARQYLYTEIPTYYVFNKMHKRWEQRRKGGNNVISRMYSVGPKEGERFYLRMLLLYVPGARNFIDLRTINGVTVETFKEACKLKHLLDDDSEWENTLSEASNFQMPRELRALFAMICCHSEPINPLQLWLNYKTYMTEDYYRTMPMDEAARKALIDIQAIVNQSGNQLHPCIRYKHVFIHRIHTQGNWSP